MNRKHRLRAVTALAAIVVVGVVTGASALAEGPERAVRSAGATETPTNAKARKGSVAEATRAPRVNISGKGTKKLKQQLRRLQQAHNRLVGAHNQLLTAHNQLSTAFYDCEQTTPVTQYAGYDYNGSIGATTALDFTDPGDFVDEQVVVWVC